MIPELIYMRYNQATSASLFLALVSILPRILRAHAMVAATQPKHHDPISVQSHSMYPSRGQQKTLLGHG